MKNILAFVFIFYGFVLPCYGTQDIYQFKNPEQQIQFTALTNQLRCLVCQNQNIAESNAALANDLRGEIYQQIQQGKDDKAIISYLVARYGDFILYRPPFCIATLGLWCMPFLFLIMGFGYLFFYIYQQKDKKI